MVSRPRPAWVFFVIRFPLHRFACPFFGSPSVLLWQRGCSVASCAFSHFFPPHAKTPPPWLPLFLMRVFSLFLHPDAAAGILSRPIRSRIAWNNSRGTATFRHLEDDLPGMAHDFC